MPLSAATLRANCTFDFVKPITNWADLTQGTNQVQFGGVIDPEVWDDAYAAVLSLAGGADTTIDLQSFTNLAGEAVVFTAVLGIVVRVVPTVAASAGVSLTITPGASNGLAWFAGATDGLVVGANESFALCGDPDGDGVTVDATHKTLNFENTGADAASVTVVIVGSTL